MAVALLAAPARAEEVALEHDGLTLLGELALAEGGALSQGVLLLTHGTLAHRGMEIIATLQELLAERGRNSLAITLSLGVDRRTGMYDCAAPQRHRHEDAVAEIAAWVDWLTAQGAGPVALLGHSRGGNQTAWYAAEEPAPAVRAVVLLAPAAWDPAAAASAYEARAGRALPALLAEAEAREPGATMGALPFLHCTEAEATAGTFLSYYGHEPRRDTPRLLPRIALPTLVIAGSADTTVADLPEKVAPYLDADTRLAVVEDADHFFRDLYAEDVADLIDDFLDERF